MATLANMRALLARREQLTKELREITDNADNMNDDGVLNGEASAKFNALHALLTELEASINARARLDEGERRAQAVPVQDRADRQFESMCQQFSLLNAIRAKLDIPGVDCAREREVSAELTRRSSGGYAHMAVPFAALSLNGPMIRTLNARGLHPKLETRVISTTTPSTGPGSALIPVILDAEQYIDALRPNIVVRSLGARMLSDQRGYLDLPRLTTPTAPGWFGEGAAIPTSDAAFDRISFRPHHVGTFAEWTRDMLQNATPELEATLRYDMAMQLARQIDYGALVGSGVAPQPLGVILNPLVPMIASAAASYDVCVEIEASLSGLNALAPSGNFGWTGNSQVRKALKQVKDNYGRPLGLPLLLGQDAGYSYEWTNLATTPTVLNPLLFGNFSDMFIVAWSELDLLVDPFTHASLGNVMLRGACTIDVNVRHPESFAYCNIQVT
jgi:HK97 family phage major capsid protein